jgi:hypothetical protein
MTCVEFGWNSFHGKNPDACGKKVIESALQIRAGNRRVE